MAKTDVKAVVREGDEIGIKREMRRLSKLQPRRAPAWKLAAAACFAVAGLVAAVVLYASLRDATGPAAVASSAQLMAVDPLEPRGDDSLPPPGRLIRFLETPAALAPATTPAAADRDVPTFDGRPIRPVRQMQMLVTAYSPDERSCGIFADGVTASGYSVWTNGMKLVAADTRILPFGTIVSIPGYNGGRPVQVLDRGGKIKGHRLDVLYPTHEIALQFGAQRLGVTVWEYAD